MTAWLRVAAAWTFTVAYALPVVVVHAVARRALGEDWVVGQVHRWADVVLRLLGIRLVVDGPDTLTGRAPRVVVANHESALDVVWVARLLPPGPLGIGKKEVIWIPVVNLAWWALGFIRVDRADPARAVAALDGVAARIARERRSLFVAPEGTRSPDGRMLPFKKGAFHLAIQAQAPVVPLVVHGAFEAMPRRAWVPRRGVLRVRRLPPIPTAGLTLADVDSLRDRVRDAMIAAKAELASG